MLHIIGTHFSAILHGDIEIERGDMTKAVVISCSAGMFFVPPGIFDAHSKTFVDSAEVR